MEQDNAKALLAIIGFQISLLRLPGFSADAPINQLEQLRVDPASASIPCAA